MSLTAFKTMSDSTKAYADKMTALRKLENLGVTTLSQSLFLLTVNFTPKMTYREIASCIGKTKDCAWRIAKAMSQKGFVEIEKMDPNIKGVPRYFLLTDKGREAIQFILLKA